MVAMDDVHVGFVITVALPMVESAENTLTENGTSMKLEKRVQIELYEAVLPQGMYTGME